MRLSGVFDTKEDRRAKKDGIQNWKAVRDSVDKVFDGTKTERDEMERHLDHFKNKIWNKANARPDESKATANFLFATIEAIAPMLSDNRPIWMLVAKRNNYQNLANLYSQALKYVWQVMDMDAKFYRWVLDALIMKVGIMKFFYDPVEDEIDCAVIDPRDFFISPGEEDIWDAPICGVRTRKPLSWIRRRFGRDIEVKPDSDMTDNPNSMKYGEAEDYQLHGLFATVYEVWLKDDDSIEDFTEIIDGEEKAETKKRFPYGKFVYFTKDKYLGCEPSDFKHGKPPYVQLYDYIIPHDFLGQGEADQISGLNKEFNLQLQKTVGHARKYGDPNMIVDINNTNLDVGVVKKTIHKGGQVWAADLSQSEGKKVIYPVDIPPMDPEVTRLLERIPNLIEEVSGVTDVSKGVASKKQRQSASEVAVLIESSYTRTRQRVRNVEWSLKRACWMIVKLMQQYYTEPRSFHYKQSAQQEKHEYGEIGNTHEIARDAIFENNIPQEVQDKAASGAQLEEDEARQIEDYGKLVKEFGKDEVYFDFDIEIETNSTLPLDKQSKANLAVRLFQLKAIDREGLLEILGFPGWEAINQRMKQEEEQQTAQKARPAGSPQQAASKPSGAPGGPQPIGQAPLQSVMQSIGAEQQ